MRSVGLMAILLLFVACKPVARGPVSDLEAVSDGNLTLGMVPVESSNGAQAYRLLICRKSASYPKWMLEDNNRCRPALLDDTGSEVVFIHDELERDFATKYTDYAKGFAVPVLIGVGATAAVFGALKWVNRGWIQKRVTNITDIFHEEKGWGMFRSRVFRFITGAPAKSVGALQNVAARTPNWVMIPKIRYRLLHYLDRTGKLASVFKPINVSATDALTEYRTIVFKTNDLHKLKEEAKLLTGFKEAGDKGGYIKGLRETVDDLKGTDNEFVTKTNKWPDKTSPDYVDRLDKMKKINAHDEFIAKYDADDSFDFQKRIDQLDSTASGAADAPPAGSIEETSKALFELKKNREYSQFGISYTGLRDLTIKGAAGIALVTMTDLDKSVFGYADRQTSMHWSQVFSEGMQSESDVKDLPTLLSVFADFFGHRVNPQALALGN